MRELLATFFDINGKMLVCPLFHPINLIAVVAPQIKVSPPTHLPTSDFATASICGTMPLTSGCEFGIIDIWPSHEEQIWKDLRPLLLNFKFFYSYSWGLFIRQSLIQSMAIQAMQLSLLLIS